MQNQNTLTQTQNKVLFPLGQTVMTHGTIEALEESNQMPIEFIKLHQSGDWGIVGAEDAQENEFSLKNGFRRTGGRERAINPHKKLFTKLSDLIT
jgi:hypothetical protein